MKLVNVRNERCTHYIGRGAAPSGIRTNLSNPFTMNNQSPQERDRVIRMFEDYAKNNTEVLRKITQLPADAVLGCWCSPYECHGDVIIKMWKHYYGED